MKVCMCVKNSFFSTKGGVYVQITKTMQKLKELNVDVELVCSPKGVDFTKYDIIHLTDLTWIYDNIQYMKSIRKSNYKGRVVLSTVYWPFDDYAKNGVSFKEKIIYGLLGVNGYEFFKSLAKGVLRREILYFNGVFRSYINTQKDIVEFSDMLLPNAESEMAALVSRIGVSKPYHVVNNGIDVSSFHSNDGVKRRNDLITFVARIDQRKNQIGFLRALMNTDYEIRFIGNAGPNSIAYFNQLKALAEKRGNVTFYSHLEQEDVFKHMAEAKVNVLTSWIETPGLVSLEAAYAGCNIVVSDKGSVRDYFGDYAFYCEPNDDLSILSAVENARLAEFNPDFREIIESKFTWEVAAKQTLEAYQRVLEL